jgi:hypothetical protein
MLEAFISVAAWMPGWETVGIGLAVLEPPGAGADVLRSVVDPLGDGAGEGGTYIGKLNSDLVSFPAPVKEKKSIMTLKTSKRHQWNSKAKKRGDVQYI